MLEAARGKEIGELDRVLDVALPPFAKAAGCDEIDPGAPPLQQRPEDPKVSLCFT
jgi:hypothetical protein